MLSQGDCLNDVRHRSLKFSWTGDCTIASSDVSSGQITFSKQVFYTNDNCGNLFV